MVHLGMLLLTYAAVVCQTSLADAVSARGIVPDFLALVVVVAAFSLRGASAVFWAAFAGLTADCLGSSHFGVNMLIAVALTYSIQSCVGTDWRKSPFAQLSIGFVMIAALVAGSIATQLLLNRQTVIVGDLLPTAFKIATYSILLAMIVRLGWGIVRRIVPGLKGTSRTQYSNRWALIDR
ncbi:MAG: rod shape-determining protein MreD [Planctomycetaceae bacterium]